MVELNVQTAIEDVVKERLDNLDIISVEVERENADEGDQILRVMITVNNKAADFDRKRLSSLVRFIRLKLDGIRETAFPLVSFMSEADAKALAP